MRAAGTRPRLPLPLDISWPTSGSWIAITVCGQLPGRRCDNSALRAPYRVRSERPSLGCRLPPWARERTENPVGWQAPEGFVSPTGLRPLGMGTFQSAFLYEPAGSSGVAGEAVVAKVLRGSVQKELRVPAVPSSEFRYRSAADVPMDRPFLQNLTRTYGRLSVALTGALRNEPVLQKAFESSVIPEMVCTRSGIVVMPYCDGMQLWQFDNHDQVRRGIARKDQVLLFDRAVEVLRQTLGSTGDPVWVDAQQPNFVLAPDGHVKAWIDPFAWRPALDRKFYPAFQASGGDFEGALRSVLPRVADVVCPL